MCWDDYDEYDDYYGDDCAEAYIAQGEEEQYLNNKWDTEEFIEYGATINDLKELNKIIKKKIGYKIGESTAYKFINEAEIKDLNKLEKIIKESKKKFV